MNNYKITGSSPTLLSRVNNNILILTLALFTVFSLVTLFVVYSLEDAVFKKQLGEVYQGFLHSNRLPDDFKLVKDLSSFNLSSSEHLKYIEFDRNDKFNEFEYQGQHYHYMNVNEGILLFDTTNVRVIDGVIDDIFVILLVVFLPSLWGTFFIAKRVSTHAIKPFTKVSEVFLSDNYSLLEAKQVIEEIKEYDLRQMAKELITALEQKSLILEQQITFNQGMAHELRTPLQIMDHSVELMQSSDESLKNKPSFRRLARSIIRMKRISEALLWLTAPSSEKQSTNVKTVVERILLESDELLSTHGIDVQITSNQSLYIPMPEVTFELIALNLLTNVVHHCQVPENEKYWKIEIDKNYVCFSNPKLIGTVVSRHKSEPRFGLGLMMIKKLTEKFAVNLKLEDEPAHYKVTLFI